MPDWIAVILLGIIEGITEFLPVSSTGHLLLVEKLFGIVKSDLFNIVIQSGAVLAVVPLFHERFRQFLFQWREKPTQDYALKILLAFFITGVGGLISKKLGLELPKTILPIAVALLAGGVAFLAVERRLQGKTLKNDVTWAMAATVGVAQLIAAVFPGTSRSGACILFLLLLGLGRPLATEYAFLVGIPTMLAAGAYEIFKALHHPAGNTTSENWPLVGLGFVASAIVSFIAVKWLLRYVQTHTFTAFGWYRIALAAVLFLLLLVKTAP
jgi:undecaprenyl-diphosphatase